ncbi:hypothetical protein [Edaphobacter aggregans]|uniref:hypothetical protein n=1 Tax=Edaphobacter aggregans TaxID=570835 RepID=UPI0007E8ED0E
MLTYTCGTFRGNIFVALIFHLAALGLGGRFLEQRLCLREHLLARLFLFVQCLRQQGHNFDLT